MKTKIYKMSTRRAYKNRQLVDDLIWKENLIILVTNPR